MSATTAPIPASLATAPSPALAKRVAIFLPALAGGGAERAMVNLADGFVRRGVSVDMVFGEVSGPYLGELNPLVRIVDLKAVGAVKKLFALSRYLKAERPAGVLSVLDNVNLAAFARRLAGVSTPVVVNVQSNLTAELDSHRGLKAKIKPMLMRWLYPWADAVTCVSEGVAADVEAAGRFKAGQVQTIYNPILIDRIEKMSVEPVEHTWFGDPEVPILLAAGRLTKQKDYPTMLRAFALVRQQRKARLFILGEGEDRAALEKMAVDLGVADDVCFFGFAKNPYAYMAKAGVFVMSSGWEGLPTVMIEAMACGLPVVSTDCPNGPTEILAGGQHGDLVPVGDHAALANALLGALGRPHRPSLSYARAAYFSADRVIEQYLDLFGLKAPQGGPA